MRPAALRTASRTPFRQKRFQVLPFPSEFGEYALIEVDQADIELHHQVEVIDESGEPLRGVWVIFGFPGGGPDIALGARENY